VSLATRASSAGEADPAIARHVGEAQTAER